MDDDGTAEDRMRSCQRDDRIGESDVRDALLADDVAEIADVSFGVVRGSVVFLEIEITD